MKKTLFAGAYNLLSENRLLFWVLSICCFLIIIIIIGEIYMRFISPDGHITPEHLKSKIENTNLSYAPSLFSRHILQAKEHFVKFSIQDTFRFQLDEGYEDSVKWYINDKGYRGKSFSAQKPKEVTRIIIYGGSFVFDIRTKKGQDWPRQVENLLNQKGLNVEVINAGVPGHMSFDSFGRFFTEGHHFNPDYVVICNKWNDIKYFRSDKHLLRQVRPYVVSKHPRIHYQGPVDRFLCNFSQFYAHLRDHYYTPKPDNTEVTIPTGEYSTEISETALNQYKLHFQLFVDAAMNLETVPILMTQPLLVTRNNTDSQRQIIEYEKVHLTHEGLCNASEKADEIVRKIATTKNVFLVDASTYLSGKEELFTDQVHLSVKGSKELATFVSSQIMHLLK